MHARFARGLQWQREVSGRCASIDGSVRRPSATQRANHAAMWAYVRYSDDANVVTGSAFGEQDDDMPNVTTHLVGHEELGDVETLFGQSRVLSGCWCMWPYSSRGEFEPSDENRAGMQALVNQGRCPGLLARVNDEPVGWCALGPTNQYPRYRSLELEQSSWAVACIYVAPPGRGRGVTGALLDRAADVAAAAGATTLYGPAPWWDAGGSEACALAATTLQEHGFAKVAEGARMPILRRDLMS